MVSKLKKEDKATQVETLILTFGSEAINMVDTLMFV